LAIAEKGLTSACKELHENVIGDKSERLVFAYKRVNPDRQRRAAIPILEHNVGESAPITIIESRIIVDYLEDAFPDSRRLVPENSLSRAHTKMFIDLCDRNLSKCLALFTSSRTTQNLYTANAALKDSLEAVESGLRMFASKPGLFFLGDSFSLVEVLLAPMLQRLLLLPPHFRPCLLKMEPWSKMEDLFPRFHEWTANIFAHPTASSLFNFDEVAAVKSHAVALYTSDGAEDEATTMTSRIQKLSSIMAGVGMRSSTAPTS
jgi:glutathione S-transferase